MRMARARIEDIKIAAATSEATATSSTKTATATMAKRIEALQLLHAQRQYCSTAATGDACGPNCNH